MGHLKYDIEILIETYQNEVSYLQSQIKECIDMGDYLGAHSFQKPLAIVQKRLKTIANLENVNYNKIQFLSHKINMAKNCDNSRKYNFLKRNLRKDELELNKLLSIKKDLRLDGEELFLAIDYLFESNLNSFDFIFNEKYDYRLNLKCIDDYILIYFSFNKEHKHSPVLGNRIKTELKKIGFILDENEKGRMKIKIPKNLKHQRIIEILSRVIFGAFELYGDRKGLIIYN